MMATGAAKTATPSQQHRRPRPRLQTQPPTRLLLPTAGLRRPHLEAVGRRLPRMCSRRQRRRRRGQTWNHCLTQRKQTPGGSSSAQRLYKSPSARSRSVRCVARLAAGPALHLPPGRRNKSNGRSRVAAAAVAVDVVTTIQTIRWKQWQR